jgi:precorrin-6B methylase 1
VNLNRGQLTVVGTGMMVAAQITQEALSAIESADKLFHVAADLITADWLLELNATAEPLHDSYREGRPRAETYEEMVERILAPVRAGKQVVAAFYGHPGVFVQPSHEAIRRAIAEGHEAVMLPGVSAEDCLFADLGFDPGERGCQSFEATDFLLRRRRFDEASYLVLWQIGGIGVHDYRPGDLWGPRGLAVLQRELLKVYPASHEVTVYEAAQFPVYPPLVHRTPLAGLTGAPVSLRSTLCVPPLADRASDPEMTAALAEPLTAGSAPE